MDGWNMIQKITSSFGSSDLRTCLHPNRRSRQEKVIFNQVPEALRGALFRDSLAAPAAQRIREQMLGTTEPLLNGASTRVCSFTVENRRF